MRNKRETGRTKRVMTPGVDAELRAKGRQLATDIPGADGTRT